MLGGKVQTCVACICVFMCVWGVCVWEGGWGGLSVCAHARVCAREYRFIVSVFAGKVQTCIAWFVYVHVQVCHIYTHVFASIVIQIRNMNGC